MANEGVRRQSAKVVLLLRTGSTLPLDLRLVLIAPPRSGLRMGTLRGGARYYVDERDPKGCSIPTISFWSASKLVSCEAKIDFVIPGLRRPPEDSLQAVSLSPSRYHRLAVV